MYVRVWLGGGGAIKRTLPPAAAVPLPRHSYHRRRPLLLRVCFAAHGRPRGCLSRSRLRVRPGLLLPLHPGSVLCHPPAPRSYYERSPSVSIHAYAHTRAHTHTHKSVYKGLYGCPARTWMRRVGRLVARRRACGRAALCAQWHRSQWSSDTRPSCTVDSIAAPLPSYAG
jgi:hypothetical protein